MPERIQHFLAAVAAALLLWSAPAPAELVIEIDEGLGDAVPVAVVPFGFVGNALAAPLDVAAVVEADLARSGRFAPMARGDMLERPTSGEEVDFSDWRLLGADVIVVGRVRTSTADEYLVDFELYDVFRAQQLLSYTIPSTRAALRATAHRVSDLVYEALTGERGAFSTRIAYVSLTGRGDLKTYELIVADADGANQSVVRRTTEPLLSPSWSPDGRRLAYVEFDDRGSAIYVHDLSAGERKLISARPGVNGAPAWSPDGDSLALVFSDVFGNVDIYLRDLASGSTRRLTHHSKIDTEPVWTADGTAILFTSDRSGGPQVYRLELNDRSAPSRVTFEGNYNARPRIAPDQSKVAVVHNDRGRYRIAVVDLDSRATRVLTEGRLDESPSFAPNGSMIIYATEDRGVGVLAAVSVDGRVHQRLLSRVGDVREPAWSPFGGGR